jgi:hypothetical protein
VANAKDRDLALVIVNPIEHTIVTDADVPAFFVSAFEFANT